MQPSLFYGMCGADTQATIRFFEDTDIRVLTCDAGQIPGRQEKGVLTREDLHAFKAPFDDAGIQLAVVTIGWMKRDPEGNSPPEEMERLCREIGALGQEGVPIAQLFETGPLPAGGECARYLDHVDGSLARLVETCAGANVRLALHGHWEPGRVLWNAESYERLFAAVPDPHNGACFCAGSFWQAGDDAVEALRRLGSRVHCVHFRDADTLGGSCPEMLLGRGKVPFAALAAALQESGFAGPVHCEHFGRFRCQQNGETAAAWGAGFMRALFGLK